MSFERQKEMQKEM